MFHCVHLHFFQVLDLQGCSDGQIGGRSELHPTSLGHQVEWAHCVPSFSFTLSRLCVSVCMVVHVYNYVYHSLSSCSLYHICVSECVCIDLCLCVSLFVCMKMCVSLCFCVCVCVLVQILAVYYNISNT